MKRKILFDKIYLIKSSFKKMANVLLYKRQFYNIIKKSNNKIIGAKILITYYNYIKIYIYQSHCLKWT